MKNVVDLSDAFLFLFVIQRRSDVDEGMIDTSVPRGVMVHPVSFLSFLRVSQTDASCGEVEVSAHLISEDRRAAFIPAASAGNLYLSSVRRRGVLGAAVLVCN